MFVCFVLIATESGSERGGKGIARGKERQERGGGGGFFFFFFFVGGGGGGEGGWWGGGRCFFVIGIVERWVGGLRG